MQVGAAVTSAAHAINATTLKTMTRNRIGNTVAAMRSDRRPPEGRAHILAPKGIQRSVLDVRVPSLWIRHVVGMPIYRGYLVEPIEQEVDAIRLHALGDREVVDPITSL